ncbi:MAG: substrate-binding domain-containing protein [Acidimicrobiales bacterium]
MQAGCSKPRRAAPGIGPGAGTGRAAALAAGLVLIGALVLAACGSSLPAASLTGTGHRARADGTAGAKGTPIDVFYAASLTAVMERQVGPAFDRETGYHFVGFPGGSKQLASEIKGGLERADVFISASPAVDKALEGRANGDWVSHAVPFGRTALEVGYDPASRFAPQLRAHPWYEVVGEAGFRLGRTNPAVDPKGVLAEEALEQAAARYHLPALRREAAAPGDVFPEDGLVGRAQSGQLDAGFFYGVEAAAAHIPTVPLSGFRLFATYTVATVNRAPHPAGAARFAAFLRAAKTQSVLRADGMTPAS